MNLHAYSLEQNLELGFCFNYNNFINNGKITFDNISNEKLPSIEEQVFEYINNLKESSTCIYQKTAKLNENNVGLSSESLITEIEVDNLDDFLKKVSNFKKEIEALIPKELESKKDLYNRLIEAYQLALEIETGDEKIKMYKDLIEGYQLALELEN